MFLPPRTQVCLHSEPGKRKRWRWCGEADFAKFVAGLRHRLGLAAAQNIAGITYSAEAGAGAPAMLADCDCDEDVEELRAGDVVWVELEDSVVEGSG